jgi:hypothetical protein
MECPECEGKRYLMTPREDGDGGLYAELCPECEGTGINQNIIQREREYEKTKE